MKLLLSLLALAATPAVAQDPIDYAGDAEALDALIAENYAYADRWPDGVLPDSDVLRVQRAAVHDGKSLLAYAETRIASLADHHAITGASFSDSWGLVPSFADLWIVEHDGNYVVEAVREGSPADDADIRSGDIVTKVGGVEFGDAVERFWSDMGLEPYADARNYAARVLATGRRDRERSLTLSRGGNVQDYVLPSLYDVTFDRDAPLSVTKGDNGQVTIRFNDSLGNNDAIAAFDAAMEGLEGDETVIIDLRDTPGGGNTTVARAIMGWFVNEPSFYQRHILPSEERSFGVKRQWVEEVAPREGKAHATMPTVMVGRWTGSMGEGLAVGFDALGATVCGGPMAGLLGAIYDVSLPSSGMVVKFPVERLVAVGGTPREQFTPPPCGE